MNECSETNLLDSNLIVFKLNKNLYCYSLKEINSILSDRPPYVNQVRLFENSEFNNSSITSRLAFKQKQSNAFIYRFPYFSIDFTLADMINKRFNTFELISVNKAANNNNLSEEEKKVQIDGLEIVMFKSWNEGEYNVKTKLYFVKPINREFLFSNNNTNTAPSLRDKEEIIETVPTPGVVFTKEEKEAEFLLQNPIAGLCPNRETVDFITGNNIVYDNELILFYIEEQKNDGVFNRVFCYTLNEITSALSSEMIRTDKPDSKYNYFMFKGKLALIKLSPTPYFLVDAFILERFLSEGFNTFKLIPQEMEGISYYQPVISERQILLPNNREIRSVFTPCSNNLTTETLVGRKDGFVYITKIIKYFDVETLMCSPNKIEEIVIKKYRDGDSEDMGVREDFNGIPAYRKYYNNDNNSIMIEERYKDGIKFVENDKPSSVKYYKNGQKRREQWLIDNRLNRNKLPADIGYHDNGNIMYREWWVDNKRHRANGNPAAIFYFENGNKERVEWWVDNKRHRDNDKPAVIAYYMNGNKRQKKWFVNGEYHRNYNLPAWIEYYRNGVISSKSWYVHNYLNRKDGKPSVIEFYENGQKTFEKWTYNGQWHRDGDLPAVIMYHENGNKLFEEWCVNGQRNRGNDEPAYIEYNRNGDKKYAVWYINDIQVRNNGLPSHVDYLDSNSDSDDEW